MLSLCVKYLTDALSREVECDEDGSSGGTGSPLLTALALARDESYDSLNTKTVIFKVKLSTLSQATHSNVDVNSFSWASHI